MFYLIEKSTDMSGTVAKAIWDKPDYTTAEMNFHQIMASAMANKNAKNMLCMIIDEKGSIMRHEYWERSDVDNTPVEPGE